MSKVLNRDSFSLSSNVKREYIGAVRVKLIERLIQHWNEAIKYEYDEPYRLIDIDKEGSPTLLMYESTNKPGVLRVEIED